LREILIASCAAAVLASTPSRVEAQRQAFVDGLAEFTSAIQGTFGDEGAQVGPTLDRMEGALAAWNRVAQSDLLRYPSNPSPDPIDAYQQFRRAMTDGNAREMQTARESLGVAYRTLLQDKSRTRTDPFVSVNILQDRVTDDAPVLPLAAYAPGYAHLARGQYADALAAFRAAAAQDPLIVDPAVRSAALTQAIAAAKQDRLGEARTLVESGNAPGSSEAHRVRGLIYWANSQDDKSIVELETAIRMNPRDERSRLTLSRVLSSAGRASDAERTLQETIRAIPDSAPAHWWLGRIYEQSNRIADARREFALAAPAALAGRAQLFTKIGQLAVSTADIPGGSDAFAQAVGANLNDPEAHKRLAGALMLQSLTGEAFVELVAALLIDPHDAGAHAGIGQILLNTGQPDDALPALRRAVELSPDYTEARYALATALMRTGRTKEAAREFELVEQSQRQTLAERRRIMSLEVLKGEAAP
jgi:tetratricopeptide (TPR) repeat protein